MLLLFKSTKVDITKAKQNPSRVRDHLANERTYLAWMRTAIALIGFGIVIVRLRILQPAPLPRPGVGWKLGLAFSLVGLVTVLLSTKHYFNSCHHIDQDSYEPAKRLILLFSFAIMLLGAGVVYFVFSSTLTAPIAVLAE